MRNFLVKKNGFDLFSDDFFNSFFAPSSNRFNTLMKTDIKENDTDYVLEMDIPGYNKDDIKISLEDKYLTISIEKDEQTEDNEENGKYIRRERVYGKTSRSFYLDNVNIESIKATFENGILKLVIPKLIEQETDKKKFITID